MAFHGKGVLIVVENLHVPTDRRVWQEATTLKAAGYSVCVISIKGRKIDRKSYECIEGIHVYRHRILGEAKGPIGYLLEYGSAIFWWFVLARRIHRRHGFQVIQACNPPDLIYLLAKRYKQRHGVRFVFDHHDVNPELYIAKFGQRDLFYYLMLYFERKTFELADYSIATNESYREIAVERGGMEPERVHVVRSGPKTENLYPVDPDPRLKRGRKYLVGYLGTIGQQEGIPHLLDAAKYIRNKLKRDDIAYTIMGGGTDQPLMAQKAVEMGLGDIFEFTGRVPNQTVRSVLSTIDICVNPDEYNEMNDKSTMNKVMEYMAMGKAQVQFDLTEGRYSAQEASLYAKPNDSVDLAEKIVWLLDHPKERQRMGSYGYKRIKEQLEWRYEAPKYLTVYRELLGEAGWERPDAPEGVNMRGFAQEAFPEFEEDH